MWEEQACFLTTLPGIHMHVSLDENSYMGPVRDKEAFSSHCLVETLSNGTGTQISVNSTPQSPLP